MVTTTTKKKIIKIPMSNISRTRCEHDIKFDFDFWSRCFKHFVAPYCKSTDWIEKFFMFFFLSLS